MRILEAHPENEETGLFLVGEKREVRRINRALLCGTLGAMATQKTGLAPLLDYILDNRSRGLIRKIPRGLVSATWAVLGEDAADNLLERLEVIVEEAVHGGLTYDQLLKESGTLQSLCNDEPPRWFTHDGFTATLSDGRIVPADPLLIEEAVPRTLNNYETQIAHEVGADALLYQAAVYGNVPQSTELPSVSRHLNTALGKMTSDGGFEHLATTLNAQYPAEWRE